MLASIDGSKTARENGYEAYSLYTMSANPYPEDTVEWYDWRAGWKDAQSKGAGIWYV